MPTKLCKQECDCLDIHHAIQLSFYGTFLVGITSDVIRTPDSTTEMELLDIINSLNETPSVNGILVQHPLPKHVDERVICDTVHPDKDVDGFHMSNIGRLCLDKPNIIPATAYAVWELLHRSGKT